MKKLLYPIAISSLFIALLTLVSCTKKETDPPSVEDQLVGKWTMKVAIGTYINYGVNSTDTVRFTANDYFDFKANGTLSIMADEVSYDGNWEIKENKLLMTNTGYLDNSTGFDLPVLTQSNLQLHYVVDSPDHYLEQKLNLVR